MSFKFPTIKRKDQRVSCLAKGLPSFCWNDLVDKDEIGRGTFGSVFVARNTANGAGDTAFVKKAGPNVVQFKGICFAPTAIMMEYFGLIIGLGS